MTIWLIWHWEIGRKRWMLATVEPSVTAARKWIWGPNCFGAMADAGNLRPMPMRVPRGFRSVIEAEAYHPWKGRRRWRVDTVTARRPRIDGPEAAQ